MPFPGFPPEARKFFKDLKRHNDRDWFQPRKEIFDTKVKLPMHDLVTALNAEFHKIAPSYINDPKKAVYRIYRDTRFSPDKTPYKLHLASIFPRQGGERGSSPGFYFHIAGDHVGVAGGVYEPQPEHLYAIRSWLAENHQAFRKAIRPTVKLMGELHGESLSRAPKGFDPEHPAIDLLKMKRWAFWAELPGELAESPKLQAELVKRFKALLPALELLNTAVGKPKTSTKAFEMGF